MDEEPNESDKSKKLVKETSPDGSDKKDTSYLYYVSEEDKSSAEKAKTDLENKNADDVNKKASSEEGRSTDTAGSSMNALPELPELESITNLPPSIDELSVAQLDVSELESIDSEPSSLVSPELDLVESLSTEPESFEVAPVEQKPAEPIVRVDIEAALSVGWEHLKSHFFLLTAVSILYLLVMLVPLAVYSVIQYLVYKNYFLLLCLSICPVVVFQLYHLGRIKAALRFNRDEAFNSDDFVTVAPLVFNFILMQICRSFLSGCAYLAFFIPGILVQTRLDFAEYFIVDKRQNAFQAIASSWKITRNSTMMLILFSITCAFVDILGLLACVVGGIPARWMTTIARAFQYERLCRLSDLIPEPAVLVEPAILNTAGSE